MFQMKEMRGKRGEGEVKSSLTVRYHYYIHPFIYYLSSQLSFFGSVCSFGSAKLSKSVEYLVSLRRRSISC